MHQHRKSSVSGFIFTGGIPICISSEPHAADPSFILTWNTLLGGSVGPDRLETMILPLSFLASSVVLTLQVKTDFYFIYSLFFNR